MPNKFWNLVQDKDDGSVVNMYVYGQIKSQSSFFGSDDDVVSGEFVRDLARFPDAKTINVYINSPGGSVFAAASIINQLKAHSATVHTWCDGICASAAVGILLAGNPGCRHMSRATLLMVHNPSTKAQGDAQVFMKTADLLAKVKSTLVSIYKEGTGLSEDKLEAMMDAETYLTADEAKELNFVDTITEDTVVYDFRNEGQLVCNDVTMDVAALLDVNHLKAALDKLTGNSNEGGKNPMSFDEILSAMSPEDRATVEAAIAAQLEARQAELETANGEATSKLTAKIEELTAQLAALQNPPEGQASVDALLKDQPQEIQDLVAQARADAIEAQRKLAEMQAAQQLEAFKAELAVFDKLPLNDDHVKALQVVSRDHPEMFAELKELFKIANNAMAAGFQATGVDGGDDVTTDPMNALESAITAYRKEHTEASYNEAMRAVLRDKPELYENYRNGFVDA